MHRCIDQIMSEKKSVIRIKSTRPDPEDANDLEKLIYGITETKYGKCLIALKEDKVCYLSFIDTDYNDDDLKKLRELFKNALLDRNDNLITLMANEIFNDEDNKEKCEVVLKGTDFEMEVWEYLCNTSRGSTVTYEKIAKAIGHPNAVKSVANAVSKNRIAYLVPCHRVIGKNRNNKHNIKYKWGANRKMQLLREEESYAKKKLIELFKKR